MIQRANTVIQIMYFNYKRELIHIIKTVKQCNINF